MQIQPITNNPQPSFGILKGFKNTPYGKYMWGEYKNYKIEIYDAYKQNQKLQYVSRKDTMRWVWSKLKYIQDGVQKVIRSKAR